MKNKTKPLKGLKPKESLTKELTDVKKGMEKAFPIIGIGASAGGLEALELFLQHVPHLSGMSFIIVQHLDPTHKGIMAELLQRSTSMQVCQIADGMAVEKNRVYVIPPNKDLSLFHGVLRLLDPFKPRGLRLPIDFFFRSLAEDLSELSVGVILSGMGSDGMLGLRAIKEAGGGSFVQDPMTSKFDGMPRSSINAGLADVVASAEELPVKIIDFFQHRPHLGSYSEISLEDKAQSAFDKIMLILRRQTGNDFSLYKKSTMYRRIERRMGIHNIERINDYVRFLQDNDAESNLLFNELLIGVTSFFRDPSAWDKIKLTVLPRLFESHPEGGVLRAWSVGCSTGEEAYSLAIIFKEAIEALKLHNNYTLLIFGTDIDKHAIDIAREGYYPQNIAADVSEERLERFFSKDTDGGFRVNKNIREQIVFAPQNIIKDPPFTKIDILICRNLLIYMEAELQKRIVPLFYYSLNPQGFLFLGSAENIYGNSDYFNQIEGTAHIFQRSPRLIETKIEDFADVFSGIFQGIYPKKIAESLKTSPESISTLTDRLILKGYAPVSVLTTRQGDIVYINGHTGKFLEPISGKANWNIFVMARERLRYPLSHTFERAVRTKKKSVVKDIQLNDNGVSSLVDIVIEPLTKPDQLSGMFLFVFTEKDVEKKRANSGEKNAEETFSPDKLQLIEDLKAVRSELMATHEDMQTSQEELKSMNEELLSSNEELQSTNEELSTAKEEMQSLNEELQTVNQELQGKLDELGRTSDDMKNLLNSTEIATLFLDEKLNVRSFTKAMASISKLIALDKGRSFTDIASTLNYPELREDAIAVLETLIFREKQISTTDGRWFLVRIMPYCTQENHINGLVITFIDITPSKTLESKLLDMENRFMAVFKQKSKGCFFLDKKGRISMTNPAAERFFKLTRHEMTGKSFDELHLKMLKEDGSVFTPDNDPFTLALRSGEPVNGFVIGFTFPSDQLNHWIVSDALPQYYQDNKDPYLLYVEFEETTEHGKEGVRGK